MSRPGRSRSYVEPPVSPHTRGPLTPTPTGLVSLRDAALIARGDAERAAGGLLALNPDAQLYPPDLGALYSATQSTGSIADGVTTQLDFTADLRTLQTWSRRDRWRVVAAQLVFSGSTTGGPYLASAWRANNQDLGHSIAFRGAGLVPIQALLPHSWAGDLTVNVQNRNGIAGTGFLTVWIGPAPVGC